MQTFHVEKGEAFKVELYFKHVIKTENHVAAAVWESGHSHGLNKKKKTTKNQLIRLGQIRSMDHGYQMDSWHSCQLV